MDWERRQSLGIQYKIHYTIASIYSLRKGIIIPLINYGEIDPDCELNIVKQKLVSDNIKAILSHSISHGGNNAVMVIRRYRD